MNHLKCMAAYGDLYQDVRVNGAVLYPGGRECEGRWNAIAPHLAACRRVLDFGSNAGYFAQRQAEQQPGCVVWSIESNRDRFNLQRDMFAENQTPNVVLTTREMGLTDWLKVANSVNPIGRILRTE
jgi:hypothetical protein